MITLPDPSVEDDGSPLLGILLTPEGPGGKWMAQCLETGLVGNAATPHEAVEDLEALRTRALRQSS